MVFFDDYPVSSLAMEHDVSPSSPTSAYKRHQEQDESVSSSAKRRRVLHDSTPYMTPHDKWTTRPSESHLSSDPRNVANRRRNQRFKELYAALDTELPYSHRPRSEIQLLEGVLTHLHQIKEQFEESEKARKHQEERKEAALQEAA